ncbi:hypothetical protein JCM33374_g94 [Metschnikowia sp. JCM 33374]|nr:hypothetical protein JCM33374_g94 [Metschnikowia sp. JCM 33374]
MKTVSNWLVTWTACLIRYPRLYIMIPILSVFLLSYPAIYDVTIGPLNGNLLGIWDDCVLTSGIEVSLQHPDLRHLLMENVNNASITRVSFSGHNALKYESLIHLSEWTRHISGASVILSPLSFLPETIFSKPLEASDEKKIEKCFLKIYNHDLPSSLITLFFNNLGKQNHLVNSAQLVNVFLFSADKNLVLPQWNQPSLKLVSHSTSDTEHAASNFVAYYNLISGKNSSFNWLFYVIISLQCLLIITYVLRVYLSICNNHKIRSNIGLIMGWLNSVLISSFASLALLSEPNSAPAWPDISDPTNMLIFGFNLLGILILSSRTLFRTVNDLAGDSSFGEPESLHKRLIKFYLGFNSSVENSRGVFHVSSFIRRTLRLDSYCNMAPIPNTTIILFINLAGLFAMKAIWGFFFCICFDTAAWSSFCRVSIKCFQLTIITLLIDHLLQLTYMVAIIVIDLHRVDLTDVLAKASAEDEINSLTLHELNPFSAWLLSSKTGSKSSWQHKLGTYLLKVALHSTWSLWLKVIPSVCLCICAAIAVQTQLFTKDKGLFVEKLRLIRQGNMVSNSNDTLYYVELVTVITLIVAISELIFTLTFSERQKHSFDSTELSSHSEMLLSDLSNVDGTRKFEAITLNETRASDKLRLFANPKAPFLVSTDLDHQVSLWSPLGKSTGAEIEDISTVFESSRESKQSCEFWPINHVEISNEGDHIVLINHRNCRIKCYNRIFRKYVWEISLTSKLAQPEEKMKPVLCFFRKKTVAGFFAREILSRRKKLSGGSKRASNTSLDTMHGNYPPPLTNQNSGGMLPGKDGQMREYEESFNREEFVMILETGEMITISCDRVKVKVYNLLTEVFASESSSPLDLRIISSKFLTTARVNDRVICTISNNEVVVGSAINNIWRFSRLKINEFFTSNSSIAFASPSMTRGTWVPRDQHLGPSSLIENKTIRDNQQMGSGRTKFSSMNESTIVTIDFVGMFVRVKDLQAELIDIQSGTVLKLFHIGSFKPGTFRVSHSEPTHCKFCGCVSFETMSLIYEDLYEKTLIVHTFRLESKKSRNNICLRVERDPLEIRCLGFDSVVESQYWFDNIEMWELTDMNVLVGVKKVTQSENEQSAKSLIKHGSGSKPSDDSIGLSSLRKRNRPAKQGKSTKSPLKLCDKWQGFVVTASDGKLLDYNIPMEKSYEQKSYCMRPNLIVKFGFKAVAIAFGHIIKIIYLGNDKLIENDLYYSGSASTLNPLLRPGADGAKTSNELLFINKRRKMIEKRFSRSNDYVLQS